MSIRDTVIIGGGHNGMVAAAMLAKAGLKPLVLERSDRIGGCAITSEITPGFRCSTLAHRAAIDGDVIGTLNLERHGLDIIRPTARVCAPDTQGRALVLWTDTTRAALEIAAFSSRDAQRYPQFLSSVAAVSAVLRTLIARPPPSVHDLSASDVLDLFKAARTLRALGRTDAHRLLRWMTMPAADFVHEWFESEPLASTIAAGGTLGSFLGPRSGGSAAVLLWLGAGEGHPVAPGWTARGGIGAVSDALARAARQAGADIRVRAEVREILVQDGAATGVVLATGERIAAERVVSNLDPRRTLLGLVDPALLPPAFLHAARHIRMRGSLAKINYAVSSLPRFASVGARAPAERDAALSGWVRLCPGLDALERAFDAAKYGGFAAEPWIELAIPSILDPGLAPPGGHVVSAYVQFAPYTLRGTTWDDERERLGDVATRTIARYAPGFEQ